MFQLVALANYSQKVCVKMNTVDNTRAASLVSLRIEITTKKTQGENKTVVSNLAINVH